MKDDPVNPPADPARLAYRALPAVDALLRAPAVAALAAVVIFAAVRVSHRKRRA